MNNKGLFSSLLGYVAKAALAYARQRWFNRLVLFSSLALFLVFLVGVAILASSAENFWNNFALNLLTELIGAFVVTFIVGGLLLGVYQEIERNERQEDVLVDWLKEFDLTDFKAAGADGSRPAANQATLEEINRKLDYVIREFETLRASARGGQSKQ